MNGVAAHKGKVIRTKTAMSAVAVAFCTLPVWGQATNELLSIDPSSADQGTPALIVTFTLDTDVPPAPPAGVMPDSVMIGDIAGTATVHDTQYVVTAMFDVPPTAAPGTHDATVNFTTPNGSLTYSLADAFTITEAADIPPVVSQHPRHATTPPGGLVVFEIVAWGTAPLIYQWQKDGENIDGATGASYEINPVSWDDAGLYRCMVGNDFGSALSDQAELIVAILPHSAYRIVDTGQDFCSDDAVETTAPLPGTPFYGQDAQHTGNAPSYAISGDGLTIYDNVTSLTWMRDADLDGDGDIDTYDKRTYSQAQDLPAILNEANYGGFNDWRVPSIKELYSLIDFRGTDPDPSATDSSQLTPFIDTDYFYFAFGDVAAGDRIIDSQWVTTSLYVADNNMMFGVNFADGRIKGYGRSIGPDEKTFFVRLCRGNPDYGTNNFVDLGDGTVLDRATGLIWAKADSGEGMNWEDALAWTQQRNAETFLGRNDWRLPDAKELQSILDYTRSPDTTGSAAINPVFDTTAITNLNGDVDYPFFWSSTTHLRFNGSAASAAYVSFGRGLGSYDDVNIVDVHGAGCQRSDPKDGDPADYPSWGHGPQGDLQRVFNHVRPTCGPFCPQDLNADGQIAAADFAVFVDCLTGPGAIVSGTCVPADLSGDGDVDMEDYAAFAIQVTGNAPADYPACLE